MGRALSVFFKHPVVPTVALLSEVRFAANGPSVFISDNKRIDDGCCRVWLVGWGF